MLFFLFYFLLLCSSKKHAAKTFDENVRFLFLFFILIYPSNSYNRVIQLLGARVCECMCVWVCLREKLGHVEGEN